MQQMLTDSSRHNKVKGINFLVDEGNEKQAVVIDLKKHRDLWEDFYDTLLTKNREKDPRETLEHVRNRILGKQ